MPESVVTPAHSSGTLTVCVVAHTHWDREWYHSAPRFRQRLVALVDSLLADAAGVTVPFLLDGQAIVLEDYLDVRPERVAMVAERLRSGALEAGPWYVLADGLIPSGEAIVRNLLAGRSVLRRFGADLTAPPVAYCPDTFGHSSAIPTIAQGFGFPLAIVWRGYGSARAPLGDTVRWQGEDGSEVLLYHLAPDGYETGSALPCDAARLEARWRVLRSVLGVRSSSGVVLLPNGADHHALQPDLADVLSALQQIAKPDEIVRESLSGFAERVAQAVQHIELPVVAGELRDSYGYTWTLGGTYGTRAHQKRANARAERALLRDVEPWLVLAWLHAHATEFEVSSDSRITLAQVPALLGVAWRTLLRAHPHDTLCGCSIDAVARSMDEHVASAQSQARGLRVAALEMALQHDAVASRRAALVSEPSVVVRNRTARWRGGVAEVLLDETMADVPVGPSSAEGSGIDALQAAPLREVATPVVGELEVQALRSRFVYRRRESPQHYPDNDLVCEHRALVWMPPVAPLGLAVREIGFRLGSRLGSEPGIGTGGLSLGSEPGIGTGVMETMSRFPFSPATARQIDGGIKLSNGRLAAHVNETGVRIEMDGRVVHNALSFETSRDVGDSYTPAIRGDPEPLSIVRVAMVASGPLRASAKLWFATLGKRQVVRVQATLSLDAASDLLRVDIRGDNQRRDHRLRVHFNSDVSDATGGARATVEVWADAAFGPVLRAPLHVPPADQATEMVPPTMPMHRWATLVQGELGATLHADGLAEVEAQREAGAIALTLLRAIGELSRNNLPERPGHAGWPASIPAAQSIGAFRAQIGLQLHGAWSQKTRDAIEHASDALLLPLTGGTMRDLSRTYFDVPGPLLAGAGLRQSAVKLADDGDGIVLRCVNDSFDAHGGSWTLPNVATMQFALARLDEAVVGAWQPLQERIEFTAAPRATVTFRVRRLAP